MLWVWRGVKGCGGVWRGVEGCGGVCGGVWTGFGFGFGGRSLSPQDAWGVHDGVPDDSAEWPAMPYEMHSTQRPSMDPGPGLDMRSGKPAPE